MITISESAKAKIKDLLLEENNPKLALRTFVQVADSAMDLPLMM